MIEFELKNKDYLILLDLLIDYVTLQAELGSPEKGIEKIKDLIESGVIDRDELCGEVETAEELKEDGLITLDEKEESALRNIKEIICQKGLDK